jgi:hypothetical protein
MQHAERPVPDCEATAKVLVEVDRAGAATKFFMQQRGAPLTMR